jgi:hypothetical protein
MLDEDQISALVGSTLVADGDEVGVVQEVYAHSSDNLPALVSVATGDGEHLVPLPDGDVAGGQVTVDFAADVVRAAPAPSGDALTEDEFEEVYAHYGISDATMREDTGLGRTGRADQGMSRDPRGPGSADDANVGHP